ncbi:hypothetical protein C5S30_07450 [ANME-1 cluster archaeon GoMg4]|nr:hypothetical protein [ANME-1 cluster archaeon GoMg4]
MKRFRRDVGERITIQDAMKTFKPQQRYVLNKLQIDNPEIKSDIESLKEIYFQYWLHRLKEQEEKELSPYNVPKIVCSMAMVKTK